MPWTGPWKGPWAYGCEFKLGTLTVENNLEKEKRIKIDQKRIKKICQLSLGSKNEKRCKEASKQAGRQASKQARKQGSKEARKQGRKEGRGGGKLYAQILGLSSKMSRIPCLPKGSRSKMLQMKGREGGREGTKGKKERKKYHANCNV